MFYLAVYFTIQETKSQDTQLYLQKKSQKSWWTTKHTEQRWSLSTASHVMEVVLMRCRWSDCLYRHTYLLMMYVVSSNVSCHSCLYIDLVCKHCILSCAPPMPTSVLFPLKNSSKSTFDLSLINWMRSTWPLEGKTPKLLSFASWLRLVLMNSSREPFASYLNVIRLHETVKLQIMLKAFLRNKILFPLSFTFSTALEQTCLWRILWPACPRQRPYMLLFRVSMQIAVWIWATCQDRVLD